MRSAWRGGMRGKIGVIAALFATFMFVRIFFGTVSVQNFVLNGWRMDKERQILSAETAKLEKINLHIKLVENHSPDYIEELSQKHLNLGDPRLRILK